MGSRIDITAEYVRHSDKAVLVNDGDTEAWVPFSQVVIRDDKDRPIRSVREFIRGKCLVLNMTEWLAREKGFI